MLAERLFDPNAFVSSTDSLFLSVLFVLSVLSASICVHLRFVCVFIRLNSRFISRSLAFLLRPRAGGRFPLRSHCAARKGRSGGKRDKIAGCTSRRADWMVGPQHGRRARVNLRTKDTCSGSPGPDIKRGESREMVSFIHGTAGHYPLRPFVLTESTLIRLGLLLRRFHDATMGFSLPGDVRWHNSQVTMAT